MYNRHNIQENHLAFESLNRSIDTVMALESLRSHLAQTGDISSAQRSMVSIAAEMAVTGTEIEPRQFINPNKQNLVVGLEHQINVSMENIVKTFKKLVHNIGASIKNFRFESRPMHEQLELVRERYEKVAAYKKRDTATCGIKGGQFMYVGGQLVTDIPTLTKSAVELFTDTEKIYDSIIKSAKVYADHDDMIAKTKDLDFLKDFAKKLYGNMVKMSKDIISAGKFKHFETQKDGSLVYVGKDYVGNLQYRLKIPDDKLVDWEDKLSLRRHLTKFEFWPADSQKTLNIEKEVVYENVQFSDIDKSLNACEDFDSDIDGTISRISPLYRELPNTFYLISQQDFDNARDETLFWRLAALRLFMANVRMLDNIIKYMLNWTLDNFYSLISVNNRVLSSYEWKRD